MIRIDWDAETLEGRLVGIETAVRNLEPAWREVHRIFLRFEREVFKSEGSYAGPAWKPLSPAYAAAKRRRYGQRPILVATGRLRDSFTRGEHPEHVYRPRPASVEMGSRVYYARYHQHGTLAQRRSVFERMPPGRRMGRARGRFSRLPGMPARPPLPLFTQAEGAQIVDVLLAHILRGARRAD